MRYSRQEQLEQVPEGFSRKAGKYTLGIVGCGGVGSVLAEELVRGGFNTLRLWDADVIDETNLQRQLYCESDLGRPKAQALKERLLAIDGQAEIVASVDTIREDTIDTSVAGCDLVIDATDNFATRLLINSWAERTEQDWLYTGAIRTKSAICLFKGSKRQFSAVFPCNPEEESCCEVGVLVSSCFITASMAYSEILKYFLGQETNTYQQYDCWKGHMERVRLP